MASRVKLSWARPCPWATSHAKIYLPAKVTPTHTHTQTHTLGCEWKQSKRMAETNTQIHLHKHRYLTHRQREREENNIKIKEALSIPVVFAAKGGRYWFEVRLLLQHFVLFLRVCTLPTLTRSHALSSLALSLRWICSALSRICSPCLP